MLEKSFSWLWRSVARGLKRCLTSLTSLDRTSHFKTTNLRRGQSLALLMECCARFNWKAEQALLTSLTSSDIEQANPWVAHQVEVPPHTTFVCFNSMVFFHCGSILSNCIGVWGLALGTQTTVVCVALLWRSNAALHILWCFFWRKKLLRFCSTLSDCIGVTVKSAALCGGAAEGGETVAWK